MIYASVTAGPRVRGGRRADSLATVRAGAEPRHPPSHSTGRTFSCRAGPTSGIAGMGGSMTVGICCQQSLMLSFQPKACRRRRPGRPVRARPDAPVAGVRWTAADDLANMIEIFAQRWSRSHERVLDDPDTVGRSRMRVAKRFLRTGAAGVHGWPDRRGTRPLGRCGRVAARVRVGCCGSGLARRSRADGDG